MEVSYFRLAALITTSVLLITTTTARLIPRMQILARYGTGSCLTNITGNASSADIVEICLGSRGSTCEKICVGVHIGHRIVTAAHCLFGTPNRRGSRGTVNKLATAFTVKYLDATMIVPHTGAEHHRHYSWESMGEGRNTWYYRYDIAVLRIGRTASSSGRTCPEPTDCPSVRDSCYVFKKSGENKAFRLVSLLPCANFLGISMSINCKFRDSAMCVSAPEDFSFVKGDSGSPIYCKSGQGQYYLRGIVSFGHVGQRNLAIVINTKGNIPT